MAGDTEVEMIELPHYAGMPEDLIPQARPMASPKGLDGWPPLIQQSYPLRRVVGQLDDEDDAVEAVLCALSVAPDVGDLRPMLLALLKANYAKVVRYEYRQPWRTQKVPSEGTLDVLRI
jgi:hypothetical protein